SSGTLGTGRMTASGSSVEWTAPNTPQNCTITCRVSDGKSNATATAQVDVVVQPLPNTAPRIVTLWASPTLVEPGGQSEVTANAVDADDDPLTHSWTADGEAISGSAATITWTAPAEEGTYTIGCQANDGVEDSTAKSVEIDVVTPGTDIDPSGTWQLESLTFVYLLLPHIYDDVSLTIDEDNGNGTIVLSGYYEDEPESRWEGTYRRISDHLHAISIGPPTGMMDLRLVFDGNNVTGTARHHWLESSDLEVSAEAPVSGTRVSTTATGQ
ncbi:MAG: hypothetical protein R6V07_00085, partial [Armatimonadota bacterium]